MAHSKAVTRIDRHNYPAIFTACLTILQDNGGINRVEFPDDGASVTILLPTAENWIPFRSLAKMEGALRELACNADYDTFLIGEYSDALRIAIREPELAHLWCILTLWFEDGMPIEVPNE